MCAGAQQRAVRRVPCATVDPGGAEEPAEKSESAGPPQRDPREVCTLGHKNQQSLLHLLHRHHHTFSILHVHGVGQLNVQPVESISGAGLTSIYLNSPSPASSVSFLFSTNSDMSGTYNLFSLTTYNATRKPYYQKNDLQRSLSIYM